MKQLDLRLAATLVIVPACSDTVTSATAGEVTSGTTAGSTSAASSTDTQGEGPMTTLASSDGTDTSADTGSPAGCGDGVLGGLEQCDDGNDAPDDGCEPGCVLPSGEQVWAVELDSGDDDVAYDVLVTDDGTIIAVGSRRLATGLDTWIARYDPAGNPLDEQVLDFGGGDHDESIAISPLGLGYVLAGVASVSGVEDSDDALLVAVDGDFAIVWSQRIDGGLDDRANAVSTASGGIAVAGHRAADGSFEDAWFAVYDTSGTEQWSHVDDGPDARADDAHGIAWLADGGLVVVGQEQTNFQDDLWIAAREADGSPRWEQLLDFEFGDDAAFGVIADGDDMLVSGSISSALTNSEEVWVARFAADGSAGAVISYNSNGFVFDGAEDAVVAGTDVFVAGITAATDQQRNALVGRWPDVGGPPVWTAAFDGGPGLGDAAHAIARLPDGSIVAAGEVTVLGQGTNAWIRRWAP